jgi:hypothetical protein
MLALFCFLCVVVLVVAHKCELPQPLELNDGEKNSLEYFEICGRNRPYNAKCEFNDCSCRKKEFQPHETLSLEKFKAAYDNPDFRAKVQSKIASIIGAPRRDRLITVTTINRGYVFMFLNWLCALRHNGIQMNPSDLLLFVDRASIEVFTNLKLPYKYIALEDDWYFDNLKITNDTGMLFFVSQCSCLIINSRIRARRYGIHGKDEAFSAE